MCNTGLGVEEADADAGLVRLVDDRKGVSASGAPDGSVADLANLVELNRKGRHTFLSGVFRCSFFERLVAASPNVDIFSNLDRLKEYGMGDDAEVFLDNRALSDAKNADEIFAILDRLEKYGVKNINALNPQTG